jgi:hypothetical protein
VTNLADLGKLGVHPLAASEISDADAHAANPPGDGLSLEERTPVGIPVFEPMAGSTPVATDPFDGDFPFPEQVPEHAPEAPEPVPEPGMDFGPPVPFEQGPEAFTAVGFESQPAFEPTFEAVAPAPPPVVAAPAAAPAAEAERGGRAPYSEEAAPVEADAFGGARLRGVFVNALSLALLLVFTAGILLWWRGESVLALVRRATRTSSAPLSALAKENGYYETSSGRLLVFIRGDVRSQSTVPVGHVRVRAEMVQAGRVVARAEGLAGVVPTPEELAAVASKEDAEKLDGALALRAPGQLAPGQDVPFLLTFVDYPPNMGDVTFRVAADLAPGP